MAWRRLPPGYPPEPLQQGDDAAGAGARKHKLAVLVPYRDRAAQLEAMLHALDAFLKVLSLCEPIPPLPSPTTYNATSSLTVCACVPLLP